MMLRHLVAGLGSLVLFSGTAGAEGKNYTLTIEGQTYEVAPGESVHAKLKSGADLDITFDRKAFGSFAKDGFSFEYPSTLSVAETEIDKGITQYAVINAIGSMMIVQRYASTNAGGLVDFLLSEMTKDDKNLGAKIVREPASLKLKSGQVLNGSKLTVTNSSGDVHFLAYGTDIGDGGLVAISRISADDMTKDQPMIDRFWQSFSLDAK